MLGKVIMAGYNHCKSSNTQAKQMLLLSWVSCASKNPSTFLWLQAQIVEKDKAFRAQAFTLKQANTRVQQIQQQQHELEQAHNREAALLEEELACCRDADADRDAEAGSSGTEVGFGFGQGATMRGTMRMGSLRPGSISPLKRKQSILVKALSTAGVSTYLYRHYHSAYFQDLSSVCLHPSKGYRPRQNHSQLLQMYCMSCIGWWCWAGMLSCARPQHQIRSAAPALLVLCPTGIPAESHVHIVWW